MTIYNQIISLVDSEPDIISKIDPLHSVICISIYIQTFKLAQVINNGIIIQIMLKDKDSKQSIQVTIRVRPLSQKQSNEDSRTCVRVEQTNSLFLSAGGEIKKFTFDSICFNESQQQIFNRVGRKCTVDCLEGYNCTIFAYGQTGAGKTYTMMGVSFENQSYYEHRGLIPRTMEFLFQCIERERENGVNFIIRCSFLEIYNEQIIDLLNKSNNNLQLREDTRKGVYVEGITEQIINRGDEAMEILYKGSKSRHVGSTCYNEASSRSHSVFTMQIQSKYTKNGVSNTKCRQFNFIDLAGSERTKQSTGERLKEGCNINKSLMNLASVINALSEVSEGKMQHVNYRNSKLTFLLKDSLGGNSKTNLIANISPANVFYQQTLSTLGFARRAKLIKRDKASINQDSTGNLESMKNEIKRLKQEVISLMSRTQSNGEIVDITQPQKPSEMTAIMHQYVEEQIDKQTKLELEILKLNERIIQLQNGIKQYSSNEIHLRMIIGVYEDKINRLKGIERHLNQNIGNLNENDEQSKFIISYFKNQRNDFVKQLENLRNQAENNKFLKELLKQAKIMKQDGEDESLKELLIKNTNFLNIIRTKLNEMKPENIENEFHSEYQKKMSLMEQQYSKREEEYQERLEQINLELTDFKNRNDENEKLLEQAISGHIVLEESIKNEQEVNKKLYSQLDGCKSKIKQSENQKQSIKIKSEETINELKCQISDRDAKTTILRKQVDALKAKLEKSNANETALKEEFENLEEEKYKIDRVHLQSIEQLREAKNSLLKSESQVILLQRRIETLVSENKDLCSQFSKLQQLNQQKETSFKSKIQEIERNHKVQIDTKVTQTNSLINQLKIQEQQMKTVNEQLKCEKEQLEIMISQFKKMQEEYKSSISNKEEKLKELLSLVNQKELTGEETTIQLNQAKVQLINAHSQKESLASKYAKTIDELKEKLQKERNNYETLQLQANERAQLYNSLNVDYQQKKRQCTDLAEMLNKVKSKVTILESQITNEEEKLQQLIKELDSFKNKEKEYKLHLIQMKNELFVSQKNSEIEQDALKSQIYLKDQQIEQLEKEHLKNKQRFEKQVEELTKEIESNQQNYKNQEESLKKSMQSHLLSKEKRLSEIRQALSDRQDRVKQLQNKALQLNEKISFLTDLKTTFTEQINRLETEKHELTVNNQQISQELNELKSEHEKEIEENEIIHNEQIDQKNEQIESFMLQNDSLTLQIRQLKQELTNLRNINQSLISQISIKNDNYKALSEQNEITQSQYLKLKGNFEAFKLSKEQEITSIVEQSCEKMNQLQKQHEQLQEKMVNLNEQYQKEQEFKEEMMEKLQFYEVEVQNFKKQSSSYITTVSLLTQENCTLNQQLSNYFNEKKKIEEEIAEMQSKEQQMKEQSEEQMKKLNSINSELNAQLSALQNVDLSNKQKLVELNSLTKELTLSLENERLTTSNLVETNNSLQECIKTVENDLTSVKERLHSTRTELQSIIVKEQNIKSELANAQKQYIKLSSSNDQLSKNYNILKEENAQIDSQLSKAKVEIKALTASIKQSREKFDKEVEKLNIQNTFMFDQNKKQATEIINITKTIKELTLQNNTFKQKLSKNDINLTKLTNELEELRDIKKMWELQVEDMEKLNNQIEQERASKQRLYSELCRERDNSNNLKMLIENKSAQNAQLELELQEKDSIYKKLVEKIAKNQSENKKTTNSEHYLKTIELLEKSRAEQIELRRQNEELKKVMMTMKETIEQKEAFAREVEQKSEGYCVSMHKRLQEIQNDYVELERNHEKLIKQRKLYSHDNEQLKEEIKNLKLSAAKVVQKNEEMESKIKKANLDYLQLEKEYEQLKKNQSMIPNNNDEKNLYINRLKAELAAIKTEKVLLNETLTKEREEKTRLKAEMRYGKEGNTDLTNKLQLEKKVNENKNLTQLIFQIIGQLKICVNQPKAKLETIRSTILTAIKDKNNEIKSLKEKMKECETEHYRQVPTKVDYAVHRQNRELKALSITNSNRNLPADEGLFKFEKEKDPSFLNNNSRQKMKQFEKYYAKFKYDGDNKGKNI